MSALKTQVKGSTRKQTDGDKPLVWHYLTSWNSLECQVYETTVLALCGEEITPKYRFRTGGDAGSHGSRRDVVCEYCERLYASLPAHR
jgi:hypothetical protein